MSEIILFQERWRRRPFWMAVGSILVNKAQWSTAKPIHAALAKRYRTPAGLAKADFCEVQGILRPLGLQARRAASLIAFAQAYAAYKAYVGRRPLSSFEIARMPGCGKYAEDSWAIFVEERRPDGVTDKKLLAYLKRNPLPKRRSMFKHTRQRAAEMRER